MIYNEWHKLIVMFNVFLFCCLFNLLNYCKVQVIKVIVLSKLQNITLSMSKCYFEYDYYK